MSTNKSFPTYFPACCPPEQAVDVNGLVFRIVKHENLTNADFLSHHELKTAMTADPCGRCGVSVFDSFRNASHRQKLTPRLGNAITEGQLDASAGKMLLTSPKTGHIEWWSYEGVDRALLFGQPKSCT